jgi:F0F1-type ATP synthase membrane subunit b/b'
VALLPVMLAFLGFTQFCFAGIAKLAVRHAAQLAARAAVVVIEESKDVPGTPDDIYDKERAGMIEVSRPSPPKGSSGSVNQAQNQVGGVTSSGSSGASATQNMVDIFGSADRSESRIKQIRTAAYIPLLAISPSVVDDGVQLVESLGSGELFPEMKVKNAIGKAGLERIAGALLYNLGAVAVTFPAAANSGELSDGLFGEEDHLDEMVTTRVTYLFRCQVPLASLLMCASGWSMMFGDAWVDPVTMNSIMRLVGNPPTNASDLPKWADGWKQQKAVHDRQQRRVDAYKGHEKEFKEVEWPFMLDVLLALPGSRYLVLTADAQLPLQAAHYYPRASDDDMNKMWDEQEKKAKQSGSSMPDLKGALQPIADAASSAAKAIDQQVQKIQNTIDQIETEIDKGVGAARAKVNEVKAQTKQLVDTAKTAYNDAKQQVDDKLKTAQQTFDGAKKDAQAVVDGVKDQANQIKNDAQAQLDDAKQELKDAKRQGQAAVADAQRKLDAAQQGVKDAKSQADKLVAGAQKTASEKIAQAQGTLDQVKQDGQAVLDGAQQTLADAQTSAKDLNKQAQQTFSDAKQGLNSLSQSSRQQGASALNGLQQGASQAGSKISNGVQQGVQNAGKQVSDSITNIGSQMGKGAGSIPGGPGTMSADDF